MLLYILLVCLWLRDSIAGHPPKFYNLKQADGEDSVSSKFLNKGNQNSTTCDQFLAQSTFNRSDVFGNYWLIWYFWNHDYKNNYIFKFSEPTAKLLDSFKLTLENKIKPQGEWNKTSLYMESSMGVGALLIRTNVDGLFRYIPASQDTVVSEDPELLLALKVIEPHAYLAIMNCKYHLCYALAPADKFPDYLKCEEESKKTNFRGHYEKCHIEPSYELPHTEEGSWKDLNYIE